MAGTKQGRGRKARKGKEEKVPFPPPSLIPSPFSFLPLPFLSLRRRLEVVACRGVAWDFEDVRTRTNFS